MQSMIILRMLIHTGPGDGDGGGGGWRGGRGGDNIPYPLRVNFCTGE